MNIKTYYTVYKVTNKVNGKIYIGCHKTTNLNDGYMGSGKYIKRSINSNGIENFEKEILFVYDNPEDMFNKEAELVTEDFIAEENTYNLKVGGMGGWDFANKNYDKDLRRQNGLKASKHKNCRLFGIRMKLTEEQKTKAIYNRINSGSGFDMFKGRKHTEETRYKISLSLKGKQKGANNSQYGKLWIYNDSLKISKKIYKTDIIPEGWQKGRKIKF